MPRSQISQGLGISPPSPSSLPSPSFPPSPPSPPTLPEFELEDSEFWENLCRTLSPQDNTLEAIAACQKAIAEDRKNPELWLVRSEALYELREYEQALASYDRVLEFNRDHSLALTRRCISLSRLGRYEEAIASCDRALEVDENWGEELPTLANLQRGLIFAWQGQLEDALNEYHQILLADPEHDLATVERCAVFLQLKYYQTVKQHCGNLKVLVGIYDRFLEGESDRVILWTHRGLLLDALGEDEAALSSYEKALKLAPEHSFLLTNYCATLNHLKRSADAMSACESALELSQRMDADAAFLWNQYARTLIGLGRYSEALEFLDRALRLNPNNQLQKFKLSRENTGILEKLWQRLYLEGLNNKAIALWYLNEAKQEARQSAETVPEQQSLLADARLHVSNAEDLLARVLKLDPDYIHGWFNQGKMLRSLATLPPFETTVPWEYRERLQKEREEKAVKYYERALSVPIRPVSRITCEMLVNGQVAAISPRDRRICTDILTNQGVSLFHLDRCSQALEPMERATRLNPDNFEVWHNGAIVLLCAARTDASYYPPALQAYQKTHRLNPEDIDVLLGWGLVLEGMKRYRDALAIYEKILEINPDRDDAKQGRDRMLDYLREPSF
ncbi:MAG: tetratricopeptide repeat protein [Cyanobacteria bacterium SBLK]|nr:tetratricopeptide repeat protein [Cyanobacteria bacterium SBLK]